MGNLGIFHHRAPGPAAAAEPHAAMMPAPLPAGAAPRAPAECLMHFLCDLDQELQAAHQRQPEGAKTAILLALKARYERAVIQQDAAAGTELAALMAADRGVPGYADFWGCMKEQQDQAFAAAMSAFRQHSQYVKAERSELPEQRAKAARARVNLPLPPRVNNSISNLSQADQANQVNQVNHLNQSATLATLATTISAPVQPPVLATTPSRRNRRWRRLPASAAPGPGRHGHRQQSQAHTCQPPRPPSPR